MESDSLIFYKYNPIAKSFKYCHHFKTIYLLKLVTDLIQRKMFSSNLIIFNLDKFISLCLFPIIIVVVVTYRYMPAGNITCQYKSAPH